jgi:hypothetical protein
LSDERIALAREWASTYPTNPHPDLGRAGVVCPYMVRTIRRGYLDVRSFDATQGDVPFLALARQVRAEMTARSDQVGSDCVYLAALIVPYGLPDPDLKAMVARVHATVKPEFIEAGFMAGEFWPEHQTIGLHNDDFRPFASPIPMFGIRPVVPADVHFFVKQEPTPQARQTQLQRYRKLFAGQLNEYWSALLDEAEAATSRELAGIGKPC